MMRPDGTWPSKQERVAALQWEYRLLTWADAILVAIALTLALAWSARGLHLPWLAAGALCGGVNLVVALVRSRRR
jgi:hypothetical protein